jgi:predicted nucleotidyltransferase
MSHSINMLRIKSVYEALDELGPQVIFIGGATVSLYAERLTEEVRPTEDVDILIEIMSYAEFSLLEERLRAKGFQNDVDSQIICRYRVQGIVVDVMPTKAEILGFANKWYELGAANAINCPIDKNATIRTFSAPYFIASKLEAFKGRGGNDGRCSTDFEDIVYIINNRPSVWKEMEESNNEIRQYLLESFKNLLSHKYIDEWFSVHLPYDESARVNSILGAMRSFISAKDE